MHTDKPERLRILLTEDDFEMRSFLAHALTQAGHEVFEINDGYVLRQFFTGITFSLNKGRDPGIDVVISDICIPGKTALDVLVEFKQLVREIPVILITAFGDQITHKQALRLGASAVFDKPFDVDLLVQFVGDMSRSKEPPKAGSVSKRFALKI